MKTYRWAFLEEDRLIWALSHLPDSWRDANNSSIVIFSHFSANPSLILWSSFINRGSFTFFTLYLLRRTDINLKKTRPLVNPINFNPCFMLHDMLKVPTGQNRNTVDAGHSDVQRISDVFSRNYFFFCISSSQRLGLFRNRKYLDLMFFQRFNKHLPQFNIRGSFDFDSSYFRAIKGVISEFCRTEKIMGDGMDAGITRIQSANNRRIKINSHTINLPWEWLNVNFFTKKDSVYNNLAILKRRVRQ